MDDTVIDYDSHVTLSVDKAPWEWVGVVVDRGKHGLTLRLPDNKLVWINWRNIVYARKAQNGKTCTKEDSEGNGTNQVPGYGAEG